MSHAPGLLQILTYHLPGVFSHDLQIIRYQPEPPGAGLIAILGDGANRDATLSRDADVGGGLEVAGADVDVRRSKSLEDAIHSGVLFKFYPGGDAVAMKHRRLHETQGGHGRTGSGQQSG